MRLRTLFLAALSANLVASIALPPQHDGRDSVRITNQTPAFDSVSDGSTVGERQDASPEGRFDGDSTETSNSKCSYDCSGAAWEGDAQQVKRGEIGGSSVGDDNYGVDGTSWDNGSAWDN